MSDLIRLLHIEDNADYRELVAATLRVEPALQFDLASAGSLAEGLLLCRERTFDVVLLDWTLPDSSGVESIGALRAIDSNISIVVFTAHDSENVIEAARMSGADGFLIKDLTNIKTILTTLHFAAGRRRRRDDRVVMALERMLSMLEDATTSIEQHVADP